MATDVSSVLQHFPSAEDGFTTTLASTISSGATTVPLNSVTGYANGEIVVFIVDPSNATKKQAFTGVIDTSGVQVTSVVWTSGTNQQHTAGSTVVDYVDAAHISMVSKGLLRDHNQSGYHKTLNDNNGNEWVEQGSTASAVNQVKITNVVTGGKPLISASGDDTNIDIRVQGKATGRAWTDYLPPQTFADEGFYDFVASGGVWTADSAGVNRNGSMTAMVCYINGRRLSLTAVTAHTFTASKDTYIDVLDNADGTGTIVYTEASNNAASSALAANSLRIGIIVTAAGSIAAAASINQGQQDIIVPIASSIPYAVTDSLGNLICPRTPHPIIIGYKQIVSDFTSTAVSTDTDITGLSIPVIVPTGRKIKVSLWAQRVITSAAANVGTKIFEGATQISEADNSTGSNVNNQTYCSAILSPSAGLHTYKGSINQGGAGTMRFGGGSTNPGYIMVELV